MKIDVNLYATLASRLPENCAGNSCVLDMEEGASIEDLLTLLSIAPDEPKIVFLNGIHAQPGRELKEGDRVAVFPPIAGG